MNAETFEVETNGLTSISNGFTILAADVISTIFHGYLSAERNGAEVMITHE